MAGGIGGSSGSTTTVQKADPWVGQKPYLTDAFQQAQSQYNHAGPSYYPGSTIAPLSPETQTSLNWQSQRALQGSPIQQPAQNQLIGTMNGDYLYGGSGFNAALDAATRKILPQVNSTFEMAGRSNSGLAATAKTQAIGDAFASQYGQERDNQLKSMLFAPTMENQDYQDISQLANVGAQRDALSQQQLNSNIDRFNYNQNLPNAKLQDYMNLIQGNYGGTTNSSMTQPLYRSPVSGAVGGALSVASLASMLGYSSGVGGLIGGSLGLLGGIVGL